MATPASNGARSDAEPHQLSVVIPVYRGAEHLAALVGEIEALTTTQVTDDGHPYRVVEVVMVHDHGPDDSDRVMRALADTYPWVRPVWLSRNFGQHPATLAGMASSGGEWIVTMDEDGQHDPAQIKSLLDVALREHASLVYARPTNAAPHSAFRRGTSQLSKKLIRLIGGQSDATLFHSYRLVLGEVGRSVAAYVGHGVFLDVALGWVAGRAATAPVTLRTEGDRISGYSTRTLLSHFWRMVVTSGTRALRLVSLLGAIFASLGVLLAVWFAINKLSGSDVEQGWTSLMVVILLTTGGILFALGVVAEYLGVAVNMAMGKPLYLIVADPSAGPLGRSKPAEVEHEMGVPDDRVVDR
jgi:undecaprenyl-phosphate 4-deoxy-4-formamido-L-arabinose transferase